MLLHLSETKIAPHPPEKPARHRPTRGWLWRNTPGHEVSNTWYKSVRIFPFLFQLFWVRRHHQRCCLLHLKLVRFGTDESESKVYVSCGTLRSGYRGAVIAEGSAAPPLCQLLFGQQPTMFLSAWPQCQPAGDQDKWLILERGIGAFYYTIFQRALAQLTLWFASFPSQKCYPKDTISSLSVFPFSPTSPWPSLCRTTTRPNGG